jgi:predicted ATPase
VAAAAVLGTDATFLRLARVAGLGEDAALAALDEALARRLLHETGEAGYAFTNPLVRDVAYAEAGQARREVFHRRASAVLTREDAPAETRAQGAGPAQLTLVESLPAGD